MSDNQITICGNLTRDPEQRFTQGGTGVVNFGIASNRRYQNRTTQEWESVATFVTVTVFGELGDNVCASFRKGDRVIVTGRLDYSEWETPAGEKRNTLKITADDVGGSARWNVVSMHEAKARMAHSPNPVNPVTGYDPAEEPF